MPGLTNSLSAVNRARTILLAIAAIILLSFWAPGAAHASGCENEWTNNKGGSWFEKENWSKKTVPVAGEEVCITLAGEYTVTQTQTSATVSVKALTLGAASGKQTLVVGSSVSVNAILATTAGIGVEAHGALTLTNGDTTGNNVTIEGPVTNGGTITAEPAHGGARTLAGSLTNKGTLAINTNTAFNGSKAALTNEGAITVAEARQLTISNAASVTNATGGSVTGTGTGDVFIGPATSFTEGAGTTSGSQPVIVDDAALSYTGSGSSLIRARGTGTTLSGNISSGQTLSIESTVTENAETKAAANFSNAGSIVLTNGDTTPNYADLFITAGTLTNSGSISSELAHGGARYLEGNVTNAATGTIAINTTTKYDATSALLTNEGSIKLAEGAQLTVSSKGAVTNAGGSIAGGATGTVFAGPATSFTEGAGTTSGSQPVIVDDAALSYTGSGSSLIRARGTGTTLSGNISSGQTLSIESTVTENAETKAAANFSNAGSIVLTNGDATGNYAALVVLAGTLTNSGSITSELANGGARYLEGNVTNTGTLAINAITKYDLASATLINKGKINVANGATLLVSNSPTVTNEAGSINGGASGALSQVGGTFNEGLGETSGTQPVILDDGALHYTGTGASTIAVRGASTLSGNIAAGQTLSIQSTVSEHATATAAASFTNSGTVALTNGDAAGNNATLAVTGEGTLTNKATGTINIENPHGGTRTIGGAIKNEGLLSLSAGQTLKVTDDYQQTGAGTLKTAISGSATFGAMTATGTAKLAGALVVVEVEPFLGKAGETFGILSSSARTGTFTDLDGVVTSAPGRYYLPSYSATGVTLTDTQATLSATPTEGAAGSKVTLKGTNFVPKEKVKLAFLDVKKAKTTFPTPTTGAGGEFSIEVTLSSKAAKGLGAFSATGLTVTGLEVTTPFTVS